MKTRSVKLGLLAAVLVTGAYAGAALAQGGVTVNIDLSTPPLNTAIEKIVTDPKTVTHKNGIRNTIIKEQAKMTPLMGWIDPMLTDAMKNTIKPQVVKYLQGPENQEPIGPIPGRIAPTFSAN